MATTATAESDQTDQQQPALRVQDALGYLDQVKSKFNDQPFVYNQFLDIMKEFKSQSLDTPGVIAKVSTLFRGHTDLIVGFNTFLPPGYRIEQMPHNNEIRITTLQGLQQTPATFTLAQHQQQHQQQIQQQQIQMQQQQQQSQANLVYQSTTNSATPTPHDPSQPNTAPNASSTNSTTTPLSTNNIETRITALIATTAPNQQDLPVPTNLTVTPEQQSKSIEKLYHHPSPFTTVQAVRPPIVANANYTVAKQVQQPGALVNSSPNLNNSSGQTNAVTIQTNMIVGPPPPPTSQPTVVNQNDSSKQHVQPPASMQPGSEFGFNHALNYVNKIKHRFSANPEIYQQFLEILHTYQRDQHATKVPRSKMILESEVYNQVARLFQNQRDLLEEFSQFLPDANGTVPAGSNINSLTRVHHQLSPCANVNSTNPPNLSLRHVNDGLVVMNDDIAPTKRQNSRAGNHQNKISMKRQNNSVNNLTYNSSKVSSFPTQSLEKNNLIISNTNSFITHQRPRMTSLRDVSLAEAGKHGSLNEYAFFDKVSCLTH